MAIGKTLYCFVALLILLTASGETISRQRRASVALQAIGFGLKELLSFGVDKLLNKVLDDETSKQLDNIMKKLGTIQTKITQGFADISQSLKEIPSFVEARKIEGKLLIKMYNYHVILKSFQHNGNNHTQETIGEFKKSLKEVPDLLFQLDLLISGNSRVAAGLLPGIASNVVNQQLKTMKSTSMGGYNVTRTVENIIEYRNILSTLQLSSIQIYFANCPDEPSICQIKLSDTNSRIESQVKLFEELTPAMFKLLARGEESTVYITDPKTNAVLYSNQKSSIVTGGIMDWDRIKSPNDAGLRCPQGDSSERWILVDAAGRQGYFLKQESGCFLSIDRAFIDFRPLPLVWTDGDRIERHKFLVCLPTLTADAVTFSLYADVSKRATTYTMMAHHSAVPVNVYLHVEEKKTSVYEEINSRLYLTLFLGDNAQSWSLGSEITKSTCDGRVVGSTAEREEDNAIIIAAAVGGGVGGFILIVVIIVCCCCCKCRNDNY